MVNVFVWLKYLVVTVKFSTWIVGTKCTESSIVIICRVSSFLIEQF